MESLLLQCAQDLQKPWVKIPADWRKLKSSDPDKAPQITGWKDGEQQVSCCGSSF